MATHVIDLTGKLGMAERPQVKVGGTKLTVDDSARTIMQVLALSQREMTPDVLDEMGHLLFREPDRYDELAGRLSFEGLTALVRSTIEEVMGGGAEGEGETPATT